MKHKVLICDPIDASSLSLPDDFDVTYSPTLTREALLGSVSKYDVLVVRSRTKVDSAVIEKASRLKLIARPGTGLDNIDLLAANARGIEVVNSPEALVEAVAEHVIGLMLALARRLPHADASVKSGLWEKDRFMGVELRGKTIGIVGLGRIGRRVAQIARAFDMSVLGYDIVEINRDVLTSLECSTVDLDTLFSSSEFLTLNVPLSSETRGMVDTRRLSLMKPSAFIINTSRGGVIDEAALVKALGERRIAGAALDVYEKEPPPSHDLLTAPNIITTPHIAGQTSEAQRLAITITAAKIVQYFDRRE